MAHFLTEYDGKVRRWRVQCGFECGGERCPVVGEWCRDPEGKKAREVGIYCRRHAREDGRTWDGRNKKLRQYVMSLSETDKKRVREDVKKDRGRRKKKTITADAYRKQTVSGWLGSAAFEECSVYHTNLILGELRVPPLLLGDSKKHTRVYLMNDFSLDDLKYLFEKRADGRMLYLAMHGTSRKNSRSIVEGGFLQARKLDSQLKMGKGVYASAAFAKASKYSYQWGRLDSWWSAGKVGCFALVAFWARDDEIVSYSGKWSAPWRRDQRLKRGFALGRAGDRDGGLGAEARRLGIRVGVDPSDGIDGEDVVVYDPAHVTVVGAVLVPEAPTLQAAIAAQRAMPAASGPGADRGWFLRDRERAMPRAPSSAQHRTAAKAFPRKEK